MASDRFAAFLTLVSIAASIAVNWIANIARWGGRNTGDVSATYPTLITPAAYAFAIWSVIYLGLVLFAVWQGLPAQTASANLRRVRWPIIGSCVANGSWIYLWHHNYIAGSLAAIVAMLALLASAYVRLERCEPEGAAESLLLRGTLSVYFGWITVATLVNTAVALVAYGWDGGTLTSAIWAVIVLSLAAVVCGWLSWRRRGDVVYAGTVLWAMIAIAVGQSSSSMITIVALGAAAAVVGAAFYRRLNGSTSIVSPMRSV